MVGLSAWPGVKGTSSFHAKCHSTYSLFLLLKSVRVKDVKRTPHHVDIYNYVRRLENNKQERN